MPNGLTPNMHGHHACQSVPYDGCVAFSTTDSSEFGLLVTFLSQHTLVKTCMSRTCAQCKTLTAVPRGFRTSTSTLHLVLKLTRVSRVQEMAFGPQPGFPTEGASKVFSEWARQLQKETDTLQDAIRDYESHVEGASKRKDFTASGPTRRLLLEWYPILVDAIQKEQQAVRQSG